jgi:hypothetical protein
MPVITQEEIQPLLDTMAKSNMPADIQTRLSEFIKLGPGYSQRYKKSETTYKQHNWMICIYNAMKKAGAATWYNAPYISFMTTNKWIEVHKYFVQGTKLNTIYGIVVDESMRQTSYFQSVAHDAYPKRVIGGKHLIVTEDECQALLMEIANSDLEQADKYRIIAIMHAVIRTDKEMRFKGLTAHNIAKVGELATMLNNIPLFEDTDLTFKEYVKTYEYTFDNHR